MCSSEHWCFALRGIANDRPRIIPVDPWRWSRPHGLLAIAKDPEARHGAGSHVGQSLTRINSQPDWNCVSSSRELVSGTVGTAPVVSRNEIDHGLGRMKRMPGVRRITSGVLGVLLFQLGAGSTLLPCTSHGSPDERAGSHAPMVASGSPSEDHAEMPCDEMETTPGDRSTTPSGGEDCSIPSGRTGDCGMMLSCVSLLAELSVVRSAEGAPNSLRVAAFAVRTPRTVFAGPDHPPPRA